MWRGGASLGCRGRRVDRTVIWVCVCVRWGWWRGSTGVEAGLTVLGIVGKWKRTDWRRIGRLLARWLRPRRPSAAALCFCGDFLASSFLRALRLSWALHPPASSVWRRRTCWGCWFESGPLPLFSLGLSPQFNELFWHEAQFSLVHDAKTLVVIMKVTFDGGIYKHWSNDSWKDLELNDVDIKWYYNIFRLWWYFDMIKYITIISTRGRVMWHFQGHFWLLETNYHHSSVVTVFWQLHD